MDGIKKVPLRDWLILGGLFLLGLASLYLYNISTLGATNAPYVCVITVAPPQAAP
jgi:hypothetical protein